MNILVCQPVTEEMKRRFAAAFPGHDFIYCENPGEAEFAEAQVLFGFPDPEKIKYCRDLRFVQLASSGAEQHNDAVPRNVPLCCATGLFGTEIAEVILGYLLSLNKYLLRYRDRQRERAWSPDSFNRPVSGSRVLILGLGDIGMHFARLMKGMNCHVTGLRRTRGACPDCADELYTLAELDALLPQADVVALCLPSTPETQRVMTRERIFAMKKGSVLINVGRGSAVDTLALLDALREGHLFGAAIDVVDPEPLPPEHPLWGAENLILTPHVAGRSISPYIIEATGDLFIENFSAFLENRPFKTPVDRETGYMVSRT